MIYAYYSLLLLFLFISLIMLLLVLIQKGRGGGLASAFGGGAGGHTAFGSKTGDVLTWATSIVFGLFLVLAIALNLVSNSLHARTERPAPGTATVTPTDGAAAPAGGATPATPAPETPAPSTPAPAPASEAPADATPPSLHDVTPSVPATQPGE